MAIAIRSDATQTSLRRLVDSYAKQGRPAITMRCAESDCGPEYTVYYGFLMDEAELRIGFAQYLKRDHPNHPVIYEIDESIPEGSED